VKRLVIAATPLLDRWSLTSAGRRDRWTWPPSPDTLFSALVAAAASLGKACHPALYWLETLGNPAIEASEDPPATHGIETFCPVADRTTWDRGSRQARWQNSIGDPAPVFWSWTIDTSEHLAALQAIAREVTYIGSSRGPVLVRAFETHSALADAALMPDVRGNTRIRGIYPGRLDELETAFQRGERPRPTQAVGYARRNKRRVGGTWEQMIALRRVAGQALDLAYSVPITEAVRYAITRHLPDGAPSLLTGHDADGSTLRGRHLALVPLSRVGDTYADGEVMGVGLLLPHGVSDSDYGALIGGLGRWLAAGGQVEIGRIRWTMEVANDDHRLSLRETRYRRPSASWASVTPVVFDRHPRRNLQVTDVVRAMCDDVGLPEPKHVEATPAGSWTGTIDSRRHHLGKRDYLRKALISHVRLEWSQEVPGPIVLGRGRYFGLGVLLPWREAA
jgi:CRISPR-associated protein Csb2